MTIARSFLVLAATSACCACLGAERPASIQGMLGIGAYEFELEPDGPVDTQVDVDDPFLMGFALQQPLRPPEKGLDVGVEGGATLGIDTQQVSGVAGGSGAVIVIDSEVVLGDVFAGLYAGVDLGGRARLFAGAGPLLQLGWVDFEQDDTSGGVDVSSTDSDTALGGYARTGLEFRAAGGTIGLTVRWIRAEMEFDGLESADLAGFQVFLSYTKAIHPDPVSSF